MKKKKLPRRVFRKTSARRHFLLDVPTALAASGALTTVGMLLAFAGWITLGPLAPPRGERGRGEGTPIARVIPKPIPLHAHVVAQARVVITAAEAPAPPVVPERVAVFRITDAPRALAIAVALNPHDFYMPLIRAVALRHSLPPSLVEAVALVESDFNRLEVSHKGARGLMQVMPETGRRFGVQPEELFDAEKNLAAGAAYLNWLLGRYRGNVDLALAAYNAGENAVDSYGGIPPYRETRVYVKRVLNALRQISVREGFVTPNERG
jgi:hypothetical protein